jgi:hypothetical protein
LGVKENSFQLELASKINDNLGGMSTIEATAEVFVTAFKSLKRPQREACWNGC